MRIIDLAILTETMLPIPLRVSQVTLEEALNKTALVEVKGWAPTNLIPAETFYRGSTLILRAGTVPWLTVRNLCVEQPDSESANGRTEYTLKCKCAGGRMQRTSEDRTWTMMTPTAIITMLAGQYQLIPFIQSTSPLAFVPMTKLQRKTDWEFLQELAALLEADVDVNGQYLRVIQRTNRLNGGISRCYDLDSNPVTFKREGDPRGAVGAAATNRRKVSSVTVEQLANTVEGMLTDPVADPAVGGPFDEFSATDPTGVCVSVQATGDTVMAPAYLGKTGQFDAGAPVPSFETTPAAGAAKARHERRLIRDAVAKGSLSYTEWSPFGTPVPGAKIRLAGGELVAQGEYFVIGRKLTLQPSVEVELMLSRTGVRLPSKKKGLTVEALAGVVQVGLDTGVLPTLDGPMTMQDFGGGEQ